MVTRCSSWRKLFTPNSLALRFSRPPDRLTVKMAMTTVPAALPLFTPLTSFVGGLMLSASVNVLLLYTGESQSQPQPRSKGHRRGPHHHRSLL